MKRIASNPPLVCLLSLFLVTLWIGSVQAQIPQRISYQGQLTDDTGIPVSGPVDFTFAIYDAPGALTPLWSEAQSSVPVVDGIYNVMLGDVVPINLAFDIPYFLGVRIGTDAEMIPRQMITAVGYAFRARDADTLQSWEPDDFAPAGHGHAFADLTGEAADAQIPPTITRDAELTAALAGKADVGHSHSGADIVSGMVAAVYIDPEMATDGELAVGLAGKADVDHNHDDRYYSKAEVDAMVEVLLTQIHQLQALLEGVDRDGGDIIFSGVNVRIQNGLGETGTTNGLGNLIVGYNELRDTGFGDNDRTGSHNIVVGTHNNYSSFGGLVAGNQNAISGPFSSVSGGSGNTASGESASVSGGYGSMASGIHASVSGGSGNTALGEFASVSGGYGSTASGDYASVSGGSINQASGDYGSVSGGSYNMAIDQKASVSGGYENIASNVNASVSGGAYNEASGQYASVCGGGSNDASGVRASVSGGANNTASGASASVSGGASHSASGQYASVSGGWYNTAAGVSASVSGGANHNASGPDDWRAGGLFQDQ